jgi:hypothetical protein
MSTYLDLKIAARIKVQDPAPSQEEIDEAMDATLEMIEGQNLLPIDGGSETINISISCKPEG